MAYSNTAAVLRPDVRTVITEALDADKMFIGQNIFPIYESEEVTGQCPRWKLATGKLLNRVNTLRGKTGEYGEVTRAYENKTFTCLDRGLEERVDDAYARNVSRFFEAETAAAKSVLRNVRIDHEVRCSEALMNVTNFGAGTSPSVAYTEANIATIAFHRDVGAAAIRLNNKGLIPNSCVMSSAVFDRIRRSTLAQNFIRGAGKASDSTQYLTENDLAASLNSLGITNVFVGRMPYNSANDGQAYTATSIWGNTYIWVGKIDGGDFMNGGAGRSITWSKDASGLFVTETYRDEKRRSDMVRVRQHDVVEVIDTTSGELITTSYS